MTKTKRPKRQPERMSEADFHRLYEDWKKILPPPQKDLDYIRTHNGNLPPGLTIGELLARMAAARQDAHGTKKRKTKAELDAEKAWEVLNNAMSKCGHIPRQPEDIADEVVSKFQGEVARVLGQMSFPVLRKMYVSIVGMLENDREACVQMALRGLFFDRMAPEQFVRQSELNKDETP